jgi:NADH-quinone oxidoreductase subunit C
MDASSIVDLLHQAVPAATIEALASVDMPTIAIDRDHLVEACTALRDHVGLQFAFLADVTAVDLWPAEPRFELVYNMACVGDAYRTAGASTAAPARRLRVKVRAPGADARVPTVSSVWPTAGWPEREVFDLFGIVFEDHPDLRRILMPDDWEGHPLRKDYAVQIRKETTSWAPLQMTPEEFARNVRAGHDRADREAHPSGSKAGPRE